jgi:acetyl/propionyl-CoA carboxylase alpha subunit/acetyl-CoA carboxylase carboxyltransferase component
MKFSRILIANRGEIAIRIVRAATDLGLHTVAIYSEDDALSLHTRVADKAHALAGRGVPAYLDIKSIIQAAKHTHCDAIHPGYGFLAENAAFARRCQDEGLTFVGPAVELLELFGDKGRARAAAAAADVPIVRGINQVVSVDEARDFFSSLGPGVGMMIKATAGGGGRGSRTVTQADEIDEAYARCQSEAVSAFGNGDLYVEELIMSARHIEVQILGDLNGAVASLGERDCSIQRRYQKIVEVAPAPNLSEQLRADIIAAAIRLAKSVNYANLGTFEFLVSPTNTNGRQPFAFIEANARLQVEHTVTEEVTGVDLVQAQIRLAGGESIQDLGLDEPGIARPQGCAIQARINMETLAADGSVRPSGGTLTAYDLPGGPGVRTDGFGYTGYETSPAFDSLLAKLIVHTTSTDFSNAVSRTSRALSEFRIEGVATNIPFLQNLLHHKDFLAGNVYTRFVDDHLADLVTPDTETQKRRFVTPETQTGGETDAPSEGLAGAQIDSRDPLALFSHDQVARRAQADQKSAAVTGSTAPAGPDGAVALTAPIQGTIIGVHVTEGDAVKRGEHLAVMEAMKMEHVITADCSGIIRRITMSVGDTIREGYPLFFIEASDVQVDTEAVMETLDPDFIRPDLAEAYRRHAYTLDENRPDAVARRRNTGQRTARENIADLCDPDTFVEFGPLAVAAQRARRDEAWLRERTPADGLVAGIGTVNGDQFGAQDARCMAIAYDYTVFAGTQGKRNHYKQDRMFHLAHRYRLPMVFFTEGGGGRPGDTDGRSPVGMDTYTFTQFSKLSGLVPLVGVTSGRCFAGNTALLACCDVIIATANSTIAMGGPAMIEGGGLGIYRPEEVGPMSFQVPNGVVDVLVENEAAAVAAAKKYMSYFQGPIADWQAPDQRLLRHIIPENRVRMYNVREVIETLADRDSVMEIRQAFGIGMITAFIRVEGQPLGLIANNPHHLAGAIDSDAADKGARFLQLCDAFDLPIVSLMDCPGIMVGPEYEATALVRHSARLFNTGANLTVPLFGLVLRKAYGLGVQAMCGGSSMVPFFTAAWPTAEFAGMNLEGAVKLGYRHELAAIEDPEERRQQYESMVAQSYENAKAVHAASYFGIDDVIDPADSRRWIVAGLRSLPPHPPRTGKKRPYIDTW